MLTRRGLLSATGSLLAIPAVARAAGANVLKFIPSVDLTDPDPLFTTAYVTRIHALLVFNTLYGMDASDASDAPQPQMVAGHVIEADGRQWRLTLRLGLRFDDGAAVLATGLPFAGC